MDFSLECLIQKDLFDLIDYALEDVDSHLLTIRKPTDRRAEGDLEAVWEELTEILVQLIRTFGYEAEEVDQELKVCRRDLGINEFKRRGDRFVSNHFIYI